MFSRDGTRLITASEDRTARVWDAVSGKPVTPPLEAGYAVYQARFSPDGTWVVTGGSAQSYSGVDIWDARRGTKIHDGHSQRGAVVHVSFAPDGGSVVSDSLSSRTLCMDALTGDVSPLDTVPGIGWSGLPSWWARHIAFHPDGRRHPPAPGPRSCGQGNEADALLRCETPPPCGPSE